MKQLRHELRYDGATPEQVYTMLATPEFREAVCEFQHFPRRTVTIDATGQGMSVTVDQYRSADRVPAFARKLVGPEINIVQKEQWTSHSAADLTIVIPGKPGDMSGTVTLAEVNGGTVETVEVNIVVSIPLIGSKAEEMISGLLQKALKAENHVGRDWLAPH